jgi:hypothetical protein
MDQWIESNGLKTGYDVDQWLKTAGRSETADCVKNSTS